MWKRTRRRVRNGFFVNMYIVEHGVREEVFSRIHTSIFRPSITAPCNFSRAVSAASLEAKVTKPKPWNRSEWLRSVSIAGTYFRSPFIEDDLCIRYFTELLEQGREGSFGLCSSSNLEHRFEIFIAKSKWNIRDMQTFLDVRRCRASVGGGCAVRCDRTRGLRWMRRRRIRLSLKNPRKIVAFQSVFHRNIHFPYSAIHSLGDYYSWSVRESTATMVHWEFPGDVRWNQRPD